MDQTFDIEKYIQNLPQNVQDFVDGVEWQKRTEEIANKYGLIQGKKESLVNDTLLLLVGIINPDGFGKILEEDLGVSSIVSDQIIEDLDKRVFDYALSKVQGTENRDKSMETRENTNTEIQSPKLDKIIYPKPNLPEIKPNNLPAQTGFPVVENEVKETGGVIGIPKYIPKSINSAVGGVGSEKLKVESLKIDTEIPKARIEQTPEPKISYSPTSTVVETKKEETPFIHPIIEDQSKQGINLDIDTITPTKPSVIPRLNLNEEPKPSVSSIMDNKLNSVISSTEKKPEVKKENPIVKQYSVDPYREPME